MPKKLVKIEVTVEVEFVDQKHLKEAIVTAKRDALACKTGGMWWKNTPKKARVINKPHKISKQTR